MKNTNDRFEELERSHCLTSYVLTVLSALVLTGLVAGVFVVISRFGPIWDFVFRG